MQALAAASGGDGVGGLSDDIYDMPLPVRYLRREQSGKSHIISVITVDSATRMG